MSETTHTNAESGKQEGRNEGNFDLFVVNRWPADMPQECTKLSEGLDCQQREATTNHCPSCVTWSLLSAQWEEHQLTQRNTAAAWAFLRSEAALMGTPLTPEQERQANIGSLLDAAHEEVHRLLKLPSPVSPPTASALHRRGCFQLDGMDSDYAGWTTGQTWNGWAMPTFELAEATRLARDLGDTAFDAARNSFVTTVEGEEPLVWPRVTITTPEGQLDTWAIGAGYWTWAQEPTA